MAKPGRKPLPLEIRRLKGDPHAQRQALLGETERRFGLSMGSAAEPMVVPSFLSSELEREIYRTVVEDLFQRQVARRHDVWAYGRWATYMARWITLKREMDGRPVSTKTKMTYGEISKRDPRWQAMLELERALQVLEGTLGLNPLARQEVIRRLTAAALAQPHLIEQRPPDDGEDDGPLGFLGP